MRRSACIAFLFGAACVQSAVVDQPETAAAAQAPPADRITNVTYELVDGALYRVEQWDAADGSQSKKYIPM